MKIFIVVPAHNEGKRIVQVLRDLEKTKFPVVVIDDGSKDSTYKVAKKTKATVLQHRVNLGKGAAMKTGAEAAFLMGAEAIIFIDADGQHKAEDLPHFVKALKKNKFDIVFGSRNLDQETPLIRSLGNKFASFFINLLFGIHLSDLICGYRALTKKAYKKINWESVGYGVETEMAAKTGLLNLKHCEVPVQTLYYDKVKGVTILDALNIFFDVLKWRIIR